MIKNKEIPDLDGFTERLSAEFNLDALDDRIKLHLYVGFLLKLMTNAFNNHVNRSLKERDLTISQFNIIMFLAANTKAGKEVNQRDIEKHLNVKNPTVTGLLKRLESKGFIKRYVSEHDGRYKRIELTDKIFELDSLFKEQLNYNIFNTLSNDEELAFAKILFKINQQFDNDKLFGDLFESQENDLHIEL